MAEATAAPRTTRARSTAAKAAPAKKATPAKVEATAVTEPIKVELEYVSDTARYARFNMPKSLEGVAVGSIYAPPGTAKVLVLLVPESPEPEAGK